MLVEILHTVQWITKYKYAWLQELLLVKVSSYES